ncbi:RsmB/NOP family class I SAM-dependent RNA methyltransferase [Zavarzinia compransoris]|uniref:rRNA cytosine-C5-methylase n=1 Tax=Zavarzinia compransoris TaxID=1264899 RepID=A0A317E3D5_9PROT|nr:RsmB/NOP family class I SAM-dependent RNA methyltransferase [Zavarzinia compransoris]PWR19913.1 rRNA cytosine-C5-methylase [Zavarzinia compransoris]TDP44972.1 16S rRNA (cytosine967-C5)-methyltransferase [Zavarzinia compransoris]
MQPAARLAAAIELLAEIGAGGEAADRVVDRYFRHRRYAGKQDRAAIAGIVWHAIRRATSLPWLTGTGAHPAPRLAGLAAAVLSGFADAATVDRWCDGQGHAPAPLSYEERAALARLGEDRVPPDWVQGDYPESLGPLLLRRFGARLPTVMAAMAGRAPLDLRVNRLKAGREAVLDELRGLGLQVEGCALSPVGIRVAGRERLGPLAPFAEGRVEVQDEGSQLVALACAAAPGQAVADFCAGAGGKTLALAAEMQGRGRLLALDIDAFRLKRMEPRLTRAGIDQFVERAALDPDLLAREAGAFDAVLVDAPCSLSGTWRRNPLARQQATPERVAELAALQGRILDQAAGLVKPGGRLVYATCSVFVEEDEDVVAGFLGRRGDFAAADHAALFPGLAGGPLGLALDPAAQGTDGFFLAVMMRAA